MPKYKMIGYMPLHYGSDFLRESLLSVIDHVEKFVVLYTSKPSYGHGTDAICPDTEQELFAIASEVCGNKLMWISGYWGSEGEHRNTIRSYADGYDGIMAIDADEVFDQQDLPGAIEEAMSGAEKYVGLRGYVNFWKSFNHACYDGYTPIRITVLKNRSGQGAVNCRVYHFSCAQRREIMDYKYKVHGHKDELRENWLRDVYYAWTSENNIQDIHPVAFGLWGAVPFDKETLPAILKEHRYFNLTEL